MRLLKTAFIIFFSIFFSWSLAQDVITPQQFAAENPNPTFQLVDNQLVPAQLLELTYQCLGNAAQASGNNLVVYGFDMIDPRTYRLQGPRALQTSLRRAEQRARVQAVSFFNAVRVQARTILQDSSTTSVQDTIATRNYQETIIGNFSIQTIETLSEMSETSVQGYLIGGRTTGTKVISLGESGMCVGVRYEIPLDQSNADPSSRLRQESGASAGFSSDNSSQDEGGGGYELPPPGSVGNF
ncbi:MAG: hypothetical protein QXE80_09615 [Pyrobaculum sp.]